MRRIVSSLLVGVALTTSAVPASAGDGTAAAFGLLGGLALGSAIGAAQANSYYPGKPVYIARPPRPVYVEPLDEEPVCYIQRRRYVDAFGDVFIRRVRVCD